MTTPTARPDLARTTFSVLFIGGLILASFWVLRPFIGPGIWATTIAVATWPLLRRLQALLWGRRSLAVLALTLALALLFVVPLLLAVLTLAQNLDAIVEASKRLADWRVSAPPDWLISLPYVGERIAGFWSDTVAAGNDGLLAHVQPYAGKVVRWLAAQVGSVGMVLVQVSLVLALTALIYAQGEVAAEALLRCGHRLAGAQGEATVILAGQAIRGVALGVGVTAIVQSALGAIGLALAGVPYAGVLAVLMFLLCLAQLGPVLVLLPAVGWLYWQDHHAWAFFVLALTVVVTLLDNILRPWLIRLGADLPLLLIFAGVIGGLLAFGLVGIFVGPVVLAVAYTLMQDWIEPQQPG
jgi:predicted PurR-regulated permease PerM